MLAKMLARRGATGAAAARRPAAGAAGPCRCFGRAAAPQLQTVGGSSKEAVALARLARTRVTPYRVVLKLGNTNVKAAIVDDRRDLTVRSLLGALPTLHRRRARRCPAARAR